MTQEVSIKDLPRELLQLIIAEAKPKLTLDVHSDWDEEDSDTEDEQKTRFITYTIKKGDKLKYRHRLDHSYFNIMAYGEERIGLLEQEMDDFFDLDNGQEEMKFQLLGLPGKHNYPLFVAERKDKTFILYPNGFPEWINDHQLGDSICVYFDAKYANVLSQMMEDIWIKTGYGY